MAERRARLGVRHRLAAPGASTDDVAAAMVGLHSSDPATVFLSAWARVAGFEPADLEDVLYERRSLARMIGMRRTLFVVPTDLAPIVHAACTRALIPGERTRLIRMLEEQSIAKEGAAWLDDVAHRTFDALLARNEATAVQLTKDVPELGRKLTFGEGKTWEATVGVSTRVLFLLATEGRIVRARPLGGWTSGQYRWAPVATWLGNELSEIAPADACASLLTRWLTAFGPATLTDIRWWTGWTVRRTKDTLTAVGAIEVEVDDGPAYVAPDDVDPAPEAGRWVALLPGLDPTVMGWKERSWYLGEHAQELFDRNGNAGPTVWCDGRVVGGWGQTPSGEVAVRLLERLDREAGQAIETEVARLTAWLGDVRITPRFRTPLERTLRDA